MKNDNTQTTIYLKDYQKPTHKILATSLHFDLYDDHAVVESKLQIKQNGDHAKPLFLHGEDLELISLMVNDVKTDPAFEGNQLKLENLPTECTVKITTKIYPHKNFELKGLYQSSGNFCTQCEAEGFRKITYFLDQPDTLSIFTVTIEADAQKYPTLLSNGNPGAKKSLENGRHQAIWHDPHPKPCYLFALVAGDLDCYSDHYTTKSGLKVDLNIYVERGEHDKCDYAMDALKRSMKWDEEVYGCEYDLDVFNVVAVSDFNMGAMENKGLNIFNSKFVLADPETATDTDYEGVETVIAHEYFHNWTGNRVTCRDWFQLSLKEGLTVFRDQEFSSDMNSRGVKRIQEVKRLRQSQFAEDAGPMAHPIRPDHYIEIDNFYTPTIYEKGAEVIRMMHTMLGPQKFRAGTDLYFKRHDGQAVTCDDFVSAMQDASGIDLTYFKHWYTQSGTPHVTVIDSYDEKAQSYKITFTQETKPTASQAEKRPLTLPIKFGLIDPNGDEVTLSEDNKILQTQEASKTFIFENIKSRPTPSLFRDFSAPITLDYKQTDAQLAFMAAHDQDDFNRWESGQKLYKSVLDSLITHDPAPDFPVLHDMVTKILKSNTADPAMKAELLSLPSMTALGLEQHPISVDENFKALQALKKEISQTHYDHFMSLYHELNEDHHLIDGVGRSRRALKNLCLSYLMKTESDEAIKLAQDQIKDHPLMTDQIGGLSAIVNLSQTDLKEAAFETFHDKWQHEPLVMLKWLGLQALSNRDDTFDKVKALTKHKSFNIKNPNNVYALLLGFASGNPYHFHQKDGAAYEFIADRVIEINQFNPQPASRLVHVFIRWRQYDEVRGGLMRKALEKILASDNLSKDVFEIVSKGLAG